MEHEVLEHLDHREKNGYQRHAVPLPVGRRNSRLAACFTWRELTITLTWGRHRCRDGVAHIARSWGPAAAIVTMCWPFWPVHCANWTILTSTYSRWALLLAPVRRRRRSNWRPDRARRHCLNG